MEGELDSFIAERAQGHDLGESVIWESWWAKRGYVAGGCGFGVVA